MNSLLVFSAAIVLLFNCVLSETGNCPAFTPVDDFKLDQYLGKWYEIGRYPVWFETDVTCACTNYQVMKTTKSGTELALNMTFMVDQQQNSGVINALHPSKYETEGVFTYMPEVSPKPNNYVLKTDYKTYSLSYNCEELSGREFAWINARTQTLPEETTQELLNYLATIYKSKNTNTSRGNYSRVAQLFGNNGF